MLKIRHSAADFCLAAIGQDDKRIVPEQVRNGMPIIPQIIVIGVVKGFIRRLELDEQ
jgi:hypothetical protein